MRFCVWVPRLSDHSAALIEVAESVDVALRALGHWSSLSWSPEPAVSLVDRTIVVGWHLLSPETRLPGAVFYNLEQAGSPCLANDRMIHFLGAHDVWDYSAKNVAWLAERGIVAKYVPVGYVPELERIKQLPESARDIDVLFYGSLNPRREKVLSSLYARGVRVHAVFGVYGEARDRLIARSRAVLNVHFYAAKIFEIVRVSYLLANRVCVVSEEGEDVPKELGGEVAFVPYEQLVDRCVEVLGADEKTGQGARSRAVRGYEAFKKISMVESLRAVVGDGWGGRERG